MSPTPWWERIHGVEWGIDSLPSSAYELIAFVRHMVNNPLHTIVPVLYIWFSKRIERSHLQKVRKCFVFPYRSIHSIPPRGAVKYPCPHSCKRSIDYSDKSLEIYQIFGWG